MGARLNAFATGTASRIPSPKAAGWGRTLGSIPAATRWGMLDADVGKFSGMTNLQFGVTKAPVHSGVAWGVSDVGTSALTENTLKYGGEDLRGYTRYGGQRRGQQRQPTEQNDRNPQPYGNRWGEQGEQYGLPSGQKGLPSGQRGLPSGEPGKEVDFLDYPDAINIGEMRYRESPGLSQGQFSLPAGPMGLDFSAGPMELSAAKPRRPGGIGPFGRARINSELGNLSS